MYSNPRPPLRWDITNWYLYHLDGSLTVKMDLCVYFLTVLHAEIPSVPSEEEAQKAHREPPVSSETVILR